MSLGISAAAWTAIGALAGAGASYYASQQQAEAQRRASRQAQANADRQAKQAEQELNRANQKKPDSLGMLAAAQQSGKAGASGTMLTGPQGVDPSLLRLGKTTLLGQ